MNQSHFLAITCDILEEQEKSPVQAAICFGFLPHWLKSGAKLSSQSRSAATEIAQLLSTVI